MERRLGAAAAGEGDDDGGGAWRRGLGAAGWNGLCLLMCPSLGGEGGVGWVGVWGLGHPARVTRLTFLCLGRWGSSSRPERGCGWGYKAACLRLDATARRAGVGRGGREAGRATRGEETKGTGLQQRARGLQKPV